MKPNHLLAFPALLLLTLAGCGKSEPAVAIVNGEPITSAEFHKYLELKPQGQVVINPANLRRDAKGEVVAQPYNGQIVGSFALQALNDLVQQTILKQIAREKKLWPSEEEIQKELKQRVQDQPNYVKELLAVGFTPSMISRDIGIQLAEYRLATLNVTVTDAEVDTYIKDHPQDFMIPRTVDLLWMLVPDTKTRDAAEADLKSGQTFKVVAEKYSVVPNAKANQHRFPERIVDNLGRFGPELKPMVESTPVGGQTGWIKADTKGFGKFFVENKQDARKVPIDDSVKRRVKKALSLQKGSTMNNVQKMVQDRLRKAKVEVTLSYLKPAWDNSMKKLQEDAAAAG